MREVTITTKPVRFASREYGVGTEVEILSKLVHDGVFLARFPEGQETWLAAWRVKSPPMR